MFGTPRKKTNPYNLRTDFIDSIVKRLEKDRKERERAFKKFRRNF